MPRRRKAAAKAPAAKAPAAITDLSSAVPVSQASLLALQKHVAAAAATGAAAVPAGAAATAAHLHAAPASQLAAQHDSTPAASSAAAPAGYLQTEIHPDLRSAYPAGPLFQQQQPPFAPAQQLYTTTSMSAVAQQPQPPATPNGAPAAAMDAAMAPGSPGSQDESSMITDGRRGPRRELSTSKRAAQNRAAQRAFRQRKEGYIKKLEEQVRDFGAMENQFKDLQSENFSLREYIIHLQSKIIDLKADMPQPPASLNLGAVGLGHNLSGASAAAAAASLLSNAASAAALQRQELQQQQQQQQHQSAAAGYTPAYGPGPIAADGTLGDPKNESSLARVAQAVAQFETGTAVDAVAAAAAAAAAAAEKSGADASSSDPMDTTPEAPLDDTKAE